MSDDFNDDAHYYDPIRQEYSGATHGSIQRAIGQLSGQLSALDASVNTLSASSRKSFEMVHKRINEVEDRVTDLRIEHGRDDGADAKQAIIRGGLLTVFGGALGAYIIKQFTHGG